MFIGCIVLSTCWFSLVEVREEVIRGPEVRRLTPPAKFEQQRVRPISVELALMLMLLPLLTLPRLASIFTDCSVTDPYDCVARPGCGW